MTRSKKRRLAQNRHDATAGESGVTEETHPSGAYSHGPSQRRKKVKAAHAACTGTSSHARSDPSLEVGSTGGSSPTFTRSINSSSSILEAPSGLTKGQRRRWRKQQRRMAMQALPGTNHPLEIASNDRSMRPESTVIEPPAVDVSAIARTHLPRALTKQWHDSSGRAVQSPMSLATTTQLALQLSKRWDNGARPDNLDRVPHGEVLTPRQDAQMAVATISSQRRRAEQPQTRSDAAPESNQIKPRVHSDSIKPRSYAHANANATAESTSSQTRPRVVPKPVRGQRTISIPDSLVSSKDVEAARQRIARRLAANDASSSDSDDSGSNDEDESQKRDIKGSFAESFATEIRATTQSAHDATSHELHGGAANVDDTGRSTKLSGKEYAQTSLAAPNMQDQRLSSDCNIGRQIPFEDGVVQHAVLLDVTNPNEPARFVPADSDDETPFFHRTSHLAKKSDARLPTIAPDPASVAHQQDSYDKHKTRKTQTGDLAETSHCAVENDKAVDSSNYPSEDTVVLSQQADAQLISEMLSNKSGRDPHSGTTSQVLAERAAARDSAPSPWRARVENNAHRSKQQNGSMPSGDKNKLSLATARPTSDSVFDESDESDLVYGNVEGVTADVLPSDDMLTANDCKPRQTRNRNDIHTNAPLTADSNLQASNLAPVPAAGGGSNMKEAVADGSKNDSALRDENRRRPKDVRKHSTRKADSAFIDLTCDDLLEHTSSRGEVIDLTNDQAGLDALLSQRLESEPQVITPSFIRSSTLNGSPQVIVLRKRKMTGMSSKHFSSPARSKRARRDVEHLYSSGDADEVTTGDPLKAAQPEQAVSLASSTRLEPDAATTIGEQKKHKDQRDDAMQEARNSSPPWKFGSVDDSTLINPEGRRISARINHSLPAPQHNQPSTPAQHPAPVPATPNGRNINGVTSTPSRRSTGKISEHFIESRVDLYNTTASSRRVPAGISTVPAPSIHAEKFGIIQEELWDQPFWLVIAVTLLNKTSGRAAVPAFKRLKERFKTSEGLAEADASEVFDVIQNLGLQNQRTKTLVTIAKTWVESPPVASRLYRKRGYPDKEDGKALHVSKVVEDDQAICQGAIEIGHLYGCGAYAFDSWRIFCRDVLRGVADDYNGKNAKAKDFEPEWKRVLPADKELRACLRWMWLRSGFVWDPLTGDKRQATDEELERAARGEMEVGDAYERQCAARAAGVNLSSQESNERGDVYLETPSRTMKICSFTPINAAEVAEKRAAEKTKAEKQRHDKCLCRELEGQVSAANHTGEHKQPLASMAISDDRTPNADQSGAAGKVESAKDVGGAVQPSKKKARKQSSVAKVVKKIATPSKPEPVLDKSTGKGKNTRVEDGQPTGSRSRKGRHVSDDDSDYKPPQPRAARTRGTYKA